MSEVDKSQEQTGDLSAVEKAAEIIKKTAATMVKEAGANPPDEAAVVAKAVEALKAELTDKDEPISMPAIRAAVAEAVRAAMGKEEDKPEDEKADEKADETKPGAHYDEEMKALKAQVSELKESIATVAKHADDTLDAARMRPGNTAPALVKMCKEAEFKVGMHREEVLAKTWAEYPTRAGISEAAGYNIVKQGEFTDMERKATALTTTDIPGSEVGMTPVWRTILEEGKIANLLRSLKVGGSSFKLTRIKEGVFSSRTTVNPAYNPSSAADALTEDTVDLSEFYNDFPAADATLEDNDGIPQRIAEGFAQQYVATLDEQAFAKLKSSAATGQKVNTGLAAGLPAVGNIFDKLLELKRAVALPYRDNGIWIINSDIEELLIQNYRAGAGMAWDPFTTGKLSQLLGRPLVVTDRLDDTSTATAGEVCAMYGQWDKTGVVAERVAMTVWQQYYAPGYHLWAARGRYAIGIEELTSYAILQVGA